MVVMETHTTFSAFAGDELIATGELRHLLIETQARLAGGEARPVLIFDDRTGVQTDFDLRGTPSEVIDRSVQHPTQRRAPGRPRLGVVSREVSLLPRHWEWLESQSGGASAALRRLVDEARKADPDADEARRRRETAGRVLWALAGNLAGFEEATRALYVADRPRLDALMGPWPVDIRAYVARILDAT